MCLIETECSSLKNQLLKADTEHKASIAEHEKKFLQLSEEMGNKNSEVSELIFLCTVGIRPVFKWSNVGCLWNGPVFEWSDKLAAILSQWYSKGRFWYIAVACRLAFKNWTI